MTGKGQPPPPEDSFEVDHVIVAVDDLDAAAARLLDRHGLRAVPGGRHPGHGTGNAVVPLGAAYLELMTVVDPVEAEGSELGRFVVEFIAGGGGPMALCLRTGDISEVCRQRGLQPLAMGRRLPDGSELRWRLAGLDEMLGVDRLPFFIQWEAAPGRHPAETPVEHPGGAATLDRVVIGGDPDRMASWLGGAVPGLAVEPMAPGVHAIEMSLGGRQVALSVL